MLTDIHLTSQCPTPQHLQAELDALAGPLALPEKEDTWEKMEKALIRFAGVTRGGGYKHLPLFVDGVGRKGVGGDIAACVSHTLTGRHQVLDNMESKRGWADGADAL